MAASLTYNSLYLTSWEWVSKINYLTDRTFKVKGAQLSLSSDDPHMSDICPLRLLEQMMGGESQHLELYLWVYKVWWKKKKTLWSLTRSSLPPFINWCCVESGRFVIALKGLCNKCSTVCKNQDSSVYFTSVQKVWGGMAKLLLAEPQFQDGCVQANFTFTRLSNIV